MVSREYAFNIVNKYASTVAIESAARHEHANDVIAMMIFMDKWTPRKYIEDETVIFNEQPMTCTKDHDSRERIWLTPDANPLYWRPWHATYPELALPWLNPLVSKHSYYKGEFVTYQIEENEANATLVTHVFKCLEDDVVYSPSDEPQSWEVYILSIAEEEVIPEEPTDEVEEETFPEWEPWNGLPDSLYQIGDIVWHLDKLWVSFISNNHWEPGEYGWEEV